MGFNIKEESFTIKVTGETTEEEFAGTFKCRPVLPHALQLERDRLRRQYLGENSPTVASTRAVNQADIFSELHTAITTAPQWWTESGNGMALYDDNVVGKVYDEVNKIQNKFLKDLKARRDSAKKELGELKPAEPESPIP